MNSVQACNSERPSNGKLPNALEVSRDQKSYLFVPSLIVYYKLYLLEPSNEIKEFIWQFDNNIFRIQGLRN